MDGSAETAPGWCANDGLRPTSAANCAEHADRTLQLLRLLTLLARFGIDPTAPTLLTRRCAASS